MAKLMVLDQRASVGESTGLIDKLGSLWCRSLHNGVMWPIHGHYTCRVCHRQYQVPWDLRQPAKAVELAAAPKLIPHTVSKVGQIDGIRPESRHAVAVG
jgi:hypothetical protein